MNYEHDLFMEGLLQHFGQVAERAQFVEQIKRAEYLSTKCDGLLKFYRALWPVMKETPTDEWAMDPYEIDWLTLFTPIETALWADIRQEGVVLYPQHPIAGYFVDFGHPVAKVAIECDGKEFHRDVAKDAARQRVIESKGWTVFRITGRDCLKDDEEGEDQETGSPFVRASAARQLIRKVGRDFHLSAKYRSERT